MNNLERLKMEIKVDIPDNELEIYLAESNLISTDDYIPQSTENKIGIYQCSMAILEGISNNPANLRNYKFEEQSISDFAENIMSRIDQIERKIRNLKSEQVKQNSSQSFYLFNS